MDKSLLWLLFLPLVLALFMGGWLLYDHLTRDDPIESLEIVYRSSFDVYLDSVTGPDAGTSFPRDFTKLLDEQSRKRGYEGWADLCRAASEEDKEAFVE
ncbi:MAG: hypothetical protein ACYTFG_19610, partial [Planctomycetota bacterium]